MVYSTQVSSNYSSLREKIPQELLDFEIPKRDMPYATNIAISDTATSRSPQKKVQLIVFSCMDLNGKYETYAELRDYPTQEAFFCGKYRYDITPIEGAIEQIEYFNNLALKVFDTYD
jgi:hypothetical protein